MTTLATTDDLLIPAVKFDASDASPAECLARWQAHVAPALTVDIPFDSAPAGWSVRTSGWNVGSTMVVIGHYGAQTLTRTAHSIRADNVDHYVLHLNQGQQSLRAGIDDRNIDVGPGRLLLTDFGRPKSFGCGDGDILSLFIPRDALESLMPRQLDLHGVVPSGACSAILASHLNSLSVLLPRMTRPEAPDAMAATVQLLVASLAPSADSLALARPSIEGTLHRQICRYIEDQLTQEDLSTDRICAHFRISRSTLYRLFEPAGGVANYLKDRRLVRIHTLLCSPTQRHYMQRIAEDHGFKSATHFSRAFREKFGYSPREARAGHVAPVAIKAGAEKAANSIGNWLGMLTTNALQQRAPPALVIL